MNKSVLMYPDVNKSTEIDDISNCSGKFHSFFKVVYFKYVGTENRSRKFVSNISSRFFKLGYYVFERRNSDAELCSNFSGSGRATVSRMAYNPPCRTSSSFSENRFSNALAMPYDSGMHSGAVENFGGT